MGNEICGANPVVGMRECAKRELNNKNPGRFNFLPQGKITKARTPQGLTRGSLCP